jgi:triacylglycerol lipase
MLRSHRLAIAAAVVAVCAAAALPSITTAQTENSRMNSTQPTAFEVPLAQGTKSQIAVLKAGKGPALVIVHGIGGHKEDWVPVMKALSATHTVYALDMLGFGGSSKDLSEITIPMQAEAVRALLSQEKIASASFIGNSVGGWVTAAFAATYPQMVNRLVLVDAAGFKAMFEGPSPVNFYPATADEMSKLLQHVLYSDFAHSPEFATKALDGLKASGDAAAAEVVFKGLFASPRLEDVMPKITAPTLVVWGAQDKLFPAAVANLLEGSIKGSRKVLIDRASHFPQIDQPQVFIDTVATFLAG